MPVIVYRCLKYAVTGQVARITLNRPEAGNRIDCRLAAELRDACRRTSEGDGIRVVVLTGAGTTFSTGREPVPRDLASAAQAERRAWLDGLRVAGAVASLEIPVVVALNGDATDHGLELALAGDLRVACSGARFGLTDLTRGAPFFWDGGTQRLPRLIGTAWARDLILTGRTIDADQALTLGLVNRVAPEGEFIAEVAKLVDSILAGGPIAARYAKEAVVKGLDLSLFQGMGMEADLNVILQSTEDRAEGMRSFAEKRPPRFLGR